VETPLSLSLFWVAVGLYVVALLGFVVQLPLKGRVPSNVALGAVMLGIPFHLGSIVTRAAESGHWPLGNMYEYATAIALVVVTTFFVVAVRSGLRLVGIPTMIIAVGLLGVAYMLYVPPGQLVPALHSYWLKIHVTSMAVSSGLLTFSFLFGMFFLARHWADNRMALAAGGRVPEPSRGTALMAAAGGGVVTAGATTGGGPAPRLARSITRALPSARTLDEWSHRFVMLGFPIWSFGVVCGAIWGEHAWGRYWGWDPKETAAFITWVIFAIYLHARVTHGWRETRAALITAAGFVAIGFTLFAVNLWIAGLHSYARA
jgi:cytochrome c-type biogenesis protein CcsB